MHSLSPSAPPPSFSRGALALAPLVERFCDGRRVAVLGPATSGLAVELARRGARLVHAYDPDAGRVAEALLTQAARGVSYAALTDGELGVRDGAFDVTVISDLTEVGDVAAAVARARRLTSPSGVVVVAGGVGGRALPYYELYDALSLQLANVKMLGLVEFAGLSFVDLAAGGDGDVSVDSSLAPAGREPVAFVGVASERALTLDAFCFVELAPEASVAASAAVSDVELVELRAQLAASVGELDRLREDRAELVARVAEADRRAGGAVSALADAEAVARAAEARLVEEARARELLNTELAKAKQEHARARVAEPRALAEAAAALSRAEARERALAARVVELEASLAAASPRGDDARLTEARADVTRLTRALSDAKADAARLAGELTSAKAEGAKLGAALRDAQAAATRQAEAAGSQSSRQRDELVTARDAALAEVGRLQARTSELDARLRAARSDEARAAEGVALDLAAAEAALRERAREIAALQREIDNRGDMVRELVAQVSAFTGAGGLGARGG